MPDSGPPQRRWCACWRRRSSSRSARSCRRAASRPGIGVAIERAIAFWAYQVKLPIDVTVNGARIVDFPGDWPQYFALRGDASLRVRRREPVHRRVHPPRPDWRRRSESPRAPAESGRSSPEHGVRRAHASERRPGHADHRARCRLTDRRTACAGRLRLGNVLRRADQRWPGVRVLVGVLHDGDGARSPGARRGGAVRSPQLTVPSRRGWPAAAPAYRRNPFAPSQPVTRGPRRSSMAGGSRGVELHGNRIGAAAGAPARYRHVQRGVGPGDAVSERDTPASSHSTPPDSA